ncbi:MAG: hypothetical protein LBU51_00695 [Bacteroidales bacterium]|jgi:hypothetical protein|nr:hypothetical protein [Bacteroidales bacterium]
MKKNSKKNITINVNIDKIIDVINVCNCKKEEKEDPNSFFQKFSQTLTSILEDQNHQSA